MSTTDEESDKAVKSSWTPGEDALLREQIDKHGGPGNWTAIAEALVGRSSKSCRLRWCNQLNPAVKRGPFTEEEDKEILAAHAVYGNKWAVISRGIPGRTDNQVKNRFNSTLRRVLEAARGAPSAKRRRRSEPDSPSSPGKSANSCETRAVAESASKEDVIVGLEQLVAASLRVQRRESDSEAEDDTSAKSTATNSHAAARAADGEGSVRSAQAFADHASLLAGLQLQQQLAQLAAAAYPALHGLPVSSVPQSFPAANAVPAQKAPAPEASLSPASGVSAAMSPALIAGNSFVAALQAQLAVSHAASQVTSLWDPLQAAQYASQQAQSPADLVLAARAILAAQTAAPR